MFRCYLKAIQKRMVIASYILFALTLLLTACGGDVNETSDSGQVDVLRFGLIPADDAEEMLRVYEPVKNYLEERLDMPVELIAASDYTAGVEAMRAGHIEIAWFGPFAYLQAASRANGEAIVVGVREDSGLSTYKTVFLTHAESGIDSLEDLKGRSFAFVDPASASGHLIPLSILLDSGIKPDEDFRDVIYAGTHNSVVLAVNNRTVEAGVTSDNVYQRMTEEKAFDPDDIKIIHTSEPIPGSPITVRGDLSEELKLTIQQAFIEMPEDVASGWGGIAYYEEVEDSEYDILREIAKILDLDL